MKRVIVVAVLIALLFGCSAKDEHGNEVPNRFVTIYTQGYVRVILDTETGVEYLWRKSGYGGGLTAMPK